MWLDGSRLFHLFGRRPWSRTPLTEGDIRIEFSTAFGALVSVCGSQPRIVPSCLKVRVDDRQHGHKQDRRSFIERRRHRGFDDCIGDQQYARKNDQPKPGECPKPLTEIYMSQASDEHRQHCGKPGSNRRILSHHDRWGWWSFVVLCRVLPEDATRMDEPVEHRSERRTRAPVRGLFSLVLDHRDQKPIVVELEAPNPCVYTVYSN